MRVEVLQARAPLGHKRVGDVVPDMPEGAATELARRGIVKILGRSPVDRMMAADRTGQSSKRSRR